MKIILRSCLMLFVLILIQTSDTKAQTTNSTSTINLNGANLLREAVFPPSAQNTIDICGLSVGKKYEFFINQKNENPLISINGNIPSQSINFKANSNCQAVLLNAEYNGNGQSAPIFSVSCLDCQETEPAPQTMSVAPIVALPSLNATDMVQNVFIGGDCFDTANAQASGDLLSIGTFTGAQTSFGFDSGILLSTGYVSGAAGPSSTLQSGNTQGGTGDDDLTDLSGVASNDVSILEFDFVPTVDQVSFEYVFASEEYCDFSFSSFNDAFGFFLSGPGINGPFSNNSINIATLPDGSNVSISTVNQTANNSFFQGNGTDCPGADVAPADCGYDGFTVTLTAVANVIPCETYHIKLAIADGGDSVYDSAVFLKANSFDAGGAGVAEATVPLTGSSDAFETPNCSNAFFTFTRESGDLTQPVFIDFVVSGTATNGVDYTGIPPSPFVIPPGVNSLPMPINIILDDIAEGSETITLFLFGSCSCESAEVTLTIFDPPVLDVVVDDLEVCSGFPAQVFAQASGGIEPYFYDWGSGNAPINFTIDAPIVTTNYTVTVTDVCGGQGVQTGTVEIIDLVGTLGGDASLCGTNSSDFLEVAFSGSEGPFEIVYSIDGVTQPGIENISDNPYLLPINEQGTYSLDFVTIDGCLGSSQGVVAVAGSTTELATEVENATCAGTNTGSIDLTVSNTSGAVSYNWSNGSTLEDQAGLASGDYTVTINDGGCELVENFSIVANPPISGSVLSIVGVDCDNPTDGSIDINSSGGNGVLTYMWSNGETTEDLVGLASGTYSVTISDIDDCDEIISDIQVTGSTDVPTADIAQTGNLNCSNMDIILEIGNSSAGADYTYEWSDANGVIVSGANETDITVTAEGTYTLTVTNTINGCFAEAPIVISADNEDPVSDAGDETEITCTNMAVQLNGTASDNGDNISYSWSGPVGAVITDDDTNVPTVDMAGTYTLTVVNSDNGCSSSTTVDVQEDMIPPVVLIEAPENLDCSTTEVELDGTGSSDTGNLDYEWTTTGSGTIVSGSTLTPTVEGAGDYILTIINNDNGCEATETITVVDVSATPVISIAEPVAITCLQMSSTLDASASDSGGGLEYSWSTLSGTGTLDDDTAIITTVNGSGTFELTITDPATGCFSTEEVIVDENLSPPNIDIEEPSEISCDTPTISLDASNSDSGADISYAWSTSGAGIIVNGDTPSPSIDAPGNYELLITNNITGCSAAANIDVIGDPETPVADIELDDNITCSHLGANINGFGTSVGNNFTYSWDLDGTILPNENSFSLTNVGEGGTYTLTVFNGNNDCEATAFIEVGVDTLTPAVIAATPSNLDCINLAINLDGTASDQGIDYIYNWSTIDGNFTGASDVIDPEIDAAGVYYLEIINTANGCVALDSVEVENITTPPMISIDNPSAITCSDVTQTITSNVSTTAGNVSYVWTGTGLTGGDDTSSPTVNEGGTFTLTATDIDNGCTETATIDVDDNRVFPTANAGTTLQIDCYNPTANLDATASTGTGMLSYNWTTVIDGNITPGEETLANPEITAAGTYQVEVLDTSNDCASVAEVIITEDFNPPIASAGGDSLLDCGTESIAIDGSGSSSGNHSYVWITSNGGSIQAGEETLQSPTALTSGTYDVVVTDLGNGCTETDQVTISPNDDAPVLDISYQGDLTCLVLATELNVAIIDEDLAVTYTYDWTTTNSGNFNTATDISAPSVDADGEYLVEVTNLSNGCSSTASLEVASLTTAPTIAIAEPEEITCLTNEQSISAEVITTLGNVAYSWMGAGITNGMNTPNPTVNEGGLFILTATDMDNGCTETAQIEVVDNRILPTADAGSTAELNCYEETLNLDASASSGLGVIEYAWTATNGGVVPVGQEALVNPEITEAGTYQIQITDTSNDCVSLAEVIISQNTIAPTADAGLNGQLNCGVESLILNGSGSSTGNFAYLWTATNGGIIEVGNETSQNPSITASGNYEILVTDLDNGCTSTDEVEIVQDSNAPVLMVASDGNITCDNPTIELNGTIENVGPNFDFTWSIIGSDGNFESGDTTLDPFVDAPGTYTFSVINNDNNCETEFNITIDEDTIEPDVELAVANVIDCENNATVISSLGSNTGLGYDLAWTTTATNTPSNTETEPSVTEAGIYTLTITNTANGCSASQMVNVVEDTETPTAVALATPDITCLELLVPLSGMGSSTGTEFEYTWTNTTTGEVAGETLDLDIDEAGTYELTVLDTSNGCSETAQTVVGVDADFPDVEAGTADLLTCTNQTTTLDGVGSAAGADITYNWTVIEGIGNITNPTSISPIIDAPGIYQIQVTNTANDCISYDEVIVSQNIEEPIVSIANPDMITCVINEVTLNASSPDGNAYSWTSPNGNPITNSESATPVVSESGTYQVSVISDINGCEGTTEVFVGENIDAPTVDAGSTYLISCETGNTTLTGTSSATNATYTWTSESGAQFTGATVSVTEGGLYTLLVANLDNECEGTDETQVDSEFPTDLDAAISDANCINDYGSVAITDVVGGTPGYTYSIDNGETFTQNSTFTQLEPGAYSVIVQDLNGCEFEKEFSIQQSEILTLALDQSAYLKLGDTYQFNGQLNQDEGTLVSIVWTPEDSLSCVDCLNPSVTPLESNTYTLTVKDSLGCSASARTILNVDRTADIFLPTAFSPNGDGVNDLFQIFAREGLVEEVVSFNVYNRWGEPVFSRFGFEANDPDFAWDGTHRGESLNSAVHAFVAVIKLTDGRTEIFKGDVSLLR